MEKNSIAPRSNLGLLTYKSNGIGAAITSSSIAIALFVLGLGILTLLLDIVVGSVPAILIFALVIVPITGPTIGMAAMATIALLVTFALGVVPNMVDFKGQTEVYTGVFLTMDPHSHYVWMCFAGTLITAKLNKYVALRTVLSSMLALVIPVIALIHALTGNTDDGYLYDHAYKHIPSMASMALIAFASVFIICFFTKRKQVSNEKIVSFDEKTESLKEQIKEQETLMDDLAKKLSEFKAVQAENLKTLEDLGLSVSDFPNTQENKEKLDGMAEAFALLNQGIEKAKSEGDQESLEELTAEKLELEDWVKNLSDQEKLAMEHVEALASASKMLNFEEGKAEAYKRKCSLEEELHKHLDQA